MKKVITNGLSKSEMDFVKDPLNADFPETVQILHAPPGNGKGFPDDHPELDEIDAAIQEWYEDRELGRYLDRQVEVQTH